jgi:hypothetical protein
MICGIGLGSVCVIAAPGCHTLDGFVGGGAVSLDVLAHCGNNVSGEGALVILAVGGVVGATVGACEDLYELGVWVCDQFEPGIRWESLEGRELRRPGPASFTPVSPDLKN